MRTIFVAAFAVAAVLLANVASAEGCSVRRPLVTVEQVPVGTPVIVAVEVGGK